MGDDCTCTPENYNKKVLRYMRNPKNWGRMKNPDASGSMRSSCGDAMIMYLKVGKKKIRGKEVEFVKNIMFETTGCAGAVSTASAVTQAVKGKTFEEAMKINPDKIIGILGGLPHTKRHCCEMSVATMKEAIKNWKKGKKY